MTGIICQRGSVFNPVGFGTPAGPIVLPACGLVYSEGTSGLTLVADRDFVPLGVESYPGPKLPLTSDPVTGPLVTDGSWIYYFAAGNIRRLPIP
jgi:hypothetical protein